MESKSVGTARRPPFNQPPWLSASEPPSIRSKSFSALEEKNIIGVMPLPDWNFFIPKDGNPQSAKNKWNRWCHLQKKKEKPSSIFKKAWSVATVLKATVDLNRGAFTVINIQLFFLFSSDRSYQRNSVAQIYVLCLWTPDQEEAPCANRSFISKALSKGRRASTAGLNP